MPAQRGAPPASEPVYLPAASAAVLSTSISEQLSAEPPVPTVSSSAPQWPTCASPAAASALPVRWPPRTAPPQRVRRTCSSSPTSVSAPAPMATTPTRLSASARPAPPSVSSASARELRLAPSAPLQPTCGSDSRPALRPATPESTPTPSTTSALSATPPAPSALLPQSASPARA